jgi:squalene-associated FAD-dependent desaturase
MRTDVLVVGGGLAGLTTALACADAGLSVTLLEARRRLGGRTASFRRAGWAPGIEPFDVDTGQHVFLRCCVAYLGLLHRLGVADQVHLQSRLDVPVLRRGTDRPVRITRTRGPAPLHLAVALGRYRLLSRAQRLRLARATLALRRVDPDDPATDEQNFGDWLTEHGQDAGTVAALWDLITVATLNCPASGSSLALAATVFQLGLLTDARAGDLGWATVPLGRLHGEAGQQALAGAGVPVRTGAKVSALTRAGDGWRVSLTEASGVTARRVVLAVPPEVAERLTSPHPKTEPQPETEPKPEPEPTTGPEPTTRLGHSPIVNVHVVYDRTVLPEPFIAAVGSSVQWVFDRTAASGLPTGQVQYLAVSLSAAQDLIGRPAHEVLARILPALAGLLPGARRAEVLDAFVTREPAATFTPAPGTARLRPGPRTARPGLYLAGSWTATGWPDTMEGAVRSGNTAAAALLADVRAERPAEVSA